MARRKPEVVVVTGASAGVGRATARAFAERGAWVGLSRAGAIGWKRRGGRSRPWGPRAVLPTDVAREDEVEEAAAAVERDSGPSTCGSTAP